MFNVHFLNKSVINVTHNKCTKKKDNGICVEVHLETSLQPQRFMRAL